MNNGTCLPKSGQLWHFKLSLDPRPDCKLTQKLTQIKRSTINSNLTLCPHLQQLQQPQQPQQPSSSRVALVENFTLLDLIFFFIFICLFFFSFIISNCLRFDFCLNNKWARERERERERDTITDKEQWKLNLHVADNFSSAPASCDSRATDTDTNTDADTNTYEYLDDTWAQSGSKMYTQTYIYIYEYKPVAKWIHSLSTTTIWYFLRNLFGLKTIWNMQFAMQIVAVHIFTKKINYAKFKLYYY